VHHDPPLGYFYFTEFLTVWYNRNPEEWEVFSSYADRTCRSSSR